MGITEHDRYLEEIDLAAFQEARELSQDVDLRLGIEIDYVPGAEERMENDATALPYDYVIGSVHRVDDEEVDRATDKRIYDRYETYDLYAAYYTNVRKADQGQGGGGEDRERRGVQKLRGHHGHRERRRRAVGYPADQRVSLLGSWRMNMTIIL